jgi:hypothetical protein
MTNWLVPVFYPLVVIIAVLLLACVELRSATGSSYDTWRLQFNSNLLASQNHQTALAKIQKQQSDNNDDVEFTALCLKYFNDDGTFVATIDPQQLDTVKAAEAAKKSYLDFTGTTKCMLRGRTWLTFDQQSFLSIKDALAASAASLQKLIDTTQHEYDDLVAGHRDFVSLHELEKVRYANLIVLTPYDLLVLLLVMFMGALGGMVRLLREYGDSNRKNPDPNDYLIIPLIGLVVSIGGFVLAKTGLLLLSSTKDQTSLSPFTIGLVGVISGLMATEVIDAISRAGANMLNRGRTASGEVAEV